MAQFINSKETIVQQALDGLLAASGGALARLDGYPFIRVVVRSDWDKSRVAVISGGGSGHDTDAGQLAAPAQVQAWPGIAAMAEPIVTPLPAGLAQLPPEASVNAALLKGVCLAPMAAETDLNLLDPKSGDGDTGSTLAGACRALLARMPGRT